MLIGFFFRLPRSCWSTVSLSEGKGQCSVLQQYAYVIASEEKDQKRRIHGCRMTTTFIFTSSEHNPLSMYMDDGKAIRIPFTTALLFNHR